MLANRRRALKRGGLPFLGALVLALAGLILIGTGASASNLPAPAQEPAPAADVNGTFTEVFQCFGLSRGDTPNVSAYLETQNFGLDGVIIRTSNMMCETAFKFTDPASDIFKPDFGQVLQCWKIAKGQDPDDDVLLTTQNFGTNKATVRRATMMCENALKTRLDQPAAAPYGLTGANTVWQCFNLTDTSPTPNLPVVVTTHNFGRDTGEIGRAVLMCETARKLRLNAAGNVITFGEADRQVVECRIFNPPQDHQTPVRLSTQNFDDDTAVVRLSQLVCERAEKVRLPTIPGTSP